MTTTHEKPERIDLAKLRAERQAATQPTEQPRPALPPNPLTSYMGLPPRPGRPPLDAAQEFDEQLAKLLEQASAADGRAVNSQIEWENHQPGQAGFGAVVAQDAEWVAPFVERGDETPVAGPLHDFLTRGAHELLVEAIHARLESAYADRVLRQYAASPEAVDRVGGAAGEIREQMRALLVECRDTKDERPYRQAKDLFPRWLRANSLHAWVLNPTLSYQTFSLEAWPPEELTAEEFDADTIGLGHTRTDVPDRKIGIPSTVVKSGAKSSETSVHWGPAGPPGSRRAPGVS